MHIAPNSFVKVMNGVPLDPNKNNTMYFPSVSAQQTYFANKVKKSFSSCYYVKEQRKLKLKVVADEIYDCNYLMYQNPSFGSKWFYAYITNVEYVNNETAELTIKLDVMQTWLPNIDYNIKPSFVEREHVSDDDLFNHLLDEGLDYGEYVYKAYSKSNLFNNISFVIALSDLSPILPSELKANPRLYDGMLSGLTYWAFDASNVSGLISFIQTYYSDENATAIEYIFTIPTAFLPNGTDGQIMSGESGATLDWNYQTDFNLIDTYAPKNKKLFNYPYNLLSISNNNGNTSVYRFEDFYTPESVHFNVNSNIAPNPTVMCIPRNYKKHIDFNSSVPEYGISLTGYPLCSWTCDTYRAWVAQNTASVVVGAVGGFGATLVGAVTGNLLAFGGGVASIYSQMAQVYKASIQPDQAKGNVNNGSYNISHNMQDFYLQHLTIKREYAERIDNYFSMFGYKINKVKIPNISTRPHWNYVKTIDVCLIGSVPADDMQEIQKIYNDGVTFWKNGDEIGSYNLDNTFV
jgi:hypothetical protein